jgi:hypothetical protein
MLAIVLALVLGGLLGLAVLIAVGGTPDSTRPGKYSYPAGPDPEPWRHE